MKISQKALACNLSPMRKFHPFAVAATNNGKKIYHLNIGQPDIATPPAYFEAVRNFELPVLVQTQQGKIIQQAFHAKA